MNQLKEYLIWIVLGIPGMVLIGLVLHSLVHFETGVLIIAWNLTQLEKGKKNSKIRDRQPRDIEKEIVDRGEYSYKNNLRELIHIAISDYHPKNMEQFKKLLASWGVDIFIKNNRV